MPKTVDNFLIKYCENPCTVREKAVILHSTAHFPLNTPSTYCVTAAQFAALPPTTSAAH
jgi:hypothetical protein